MKNLTYFPFERNRYFYGKLLAVDDFETEQKYFNDKRRVINRYGIGTGIICGLDTVQVDEKTISVERGIALDFAGREIVVPVPVISQLSAFPGFSDYHQNQDRGFYYLCLEYDEKEKQITHNVAMDEKEGLESNKYEESYHLFLTTKEPQKTILASTFAKEDVREIYSGNGIKITQTVPRFAKADHLCQIKVSVENIGVVHPYSFSYQLEGVCVSGAESDAINVNFDSGQMEEKESITMTIPVKTMDVNDVTGKVMLDVDSFQLKIGNEQIQTELLDVSQNIQIVQDDILTHIAQNYHENAMEIINQNSYQQSIYLAKLWVIHAGSSYIIDQIEKVPYEQYVINQELTYSLIRELEDQIRDLQARSNGKNLNESVVQSVASVQKDIYRESGSYVFDLGIGGKSGQVFISPEIEHNLGLGPVEITVGIADAENEDCIYYGNPEIFEDCKGAQNVELGIQLDSKKGTFLIGMRLKTTTTMHFVKVYWNACKKENKTVEVQEGKLISLCPDMPSIEVGENIYFEALLSGFKDERLNWSVKNEEDGMVNQQGVYHAPNISGVYEVQVESSKYPEIKASTFVVVSDTKEA